MPLKIHQRCVFSPKPLVFNASVQLGVKVFGQ